MENAFNAYYKKQGDREVWITAKSEGAYTAFTSGGEVTEKVPVVAVAEPEETVKPAPAPVKEEVTAEPKAAGLTLPYTLNQLYFGRNEEKEFARYLNALPEGTSIQVKGYSDGTGSEAAKASVSKRRAQLLQYYIKHNFAQKSFSVSTDQEVLSGEGAAYRKAEISVFNL
ncbi:hypothetical protein ACSX1A_10465 [Pontibacter sp. MBLB2868]|uniref:hypothetical protein n=1 Tax=Pontibacter sp. MBLB2868 TaxID=3451555 RepID=UPI003F753F47